MKSKFLQKMSRLLTVTIFMTGFAPVSASDTSYFNSPAFIANGPTVAACQGHDTYASCDLNFTTSDGHAVTFDTTHMGSQSATANPNLISNYSDALATLTFALNQYSQNIFPKYNMITGAWASMVDVIARNLAPQPVGALAPIPFSVGNQNVSVVQYTAGDYVPVSTNAVELGQLARGYIQYMTNAQVTAVSGQPTGYSAVNDFVKVLLYAVSYALTVDGTPTGTPVLNEIYQSLGGTEASPTVEEELNFILANGGVGAMSSISPVTIPHLNTITNVQNQNWGAVSGQTIYDIIQSATWSNLTIDFTDTFTIYLAKALQAIVGQQMYFSCAIGMDGSTDAAVYFAEGLTPNTVTLAGQYANNQKGMPGITCGTSATQKTDPCVLNLPEITNSPSTVTSFTYQTGNIFYFVPDQFTSGDGATVINGPVYGSGLGGGTGTNSLWARQCKGSASSNAFNTGQQILSLLSSITSAAALETGFSQNNIDTLQGAEVNLLQAFNAAVALPPMAGSGIDYSWGNVSNYPIGTLEPMVIGGQSINQYSLGTTTALPNILTNFETDFMTASNLAKMMDVTNMMTQYLQCWQSYSECHNLLAGLPAGPSRTPVEQWILDKTGWDFSTTKGTVQAVMAIGFALMALPAVFGGAKWAYSGIKSALTKMVNDIQMYGLFKKNYAADTLIDTFKGASSMSTVGGSGTGTNLNKGGNGGITGGVDTIAPKTQADLDNLSVEQIKTRTEMLIESKNFNTFQAEYATLVAEKTLLEEDNQDTTEVEAKMKAYEDAANNYNTDNPSDPIDLSGE